MTDERAEVVMCNMIQWETLETKNGEPVCPECGKSAELILGLFGNPCWGHKHEPEAQA